MGDHSVFLLQQFGQKPKPLKDQGEHLQLQALVLILLWQVLTSFEILRAGDSTRFVEFMLRMILSALGDADYEIRNEPNGGDKLDRLLDKMESGVYYSRPELMEMMSAKSQPSFHRDYLGPGLERCVIYMEYPRTPRSRRQRYRRSDFRPIPDPRGTPRTMAVAI